MAREPCVGLVSVFADEVALVVKELGLEEGLPLAKAPRQQCKKRNAPIFCPLFYMCSSFSILHASHLNKSSYLLIFLSSPISDTE